MEKEILDLNTYEDEYRYLFRLQKSGRTNMFGAGEYLQSERGLSRSEAREVLTTWMTNYQEIAQQLDIEI